jgi:methyl-accepting chemotaxis protein
MKIFQFLLAPAVGLMHRLRYPYKFAAIGLLGVVAIVYLFLVLTSHLQASMNTAHREKLGVLLDKPLLTLVQAIQQHRDLSSALLGGVTSLADKRSGKAIEIRDAATAVDQVMAAHGAELGVLTDWQFAKAHWVTIRENGLQMSTRINRDVHTALIKELLLIVARIGDNSFLVLDPDANSYYLMDAATTKLPAALEMVSQLRAHAAEVLATKSLDKNGRADFVAEIAVAHAKLDELDAALQRVSTSNPAVAPRIDRFSTMFHDSIDDVLQTISGDIFSVKFAADPTQFIGKTTVAIDRGYAQSQELLLPVLDELLAKRIEQLQHQYFESAILAGPAFLILFIYLATGAYLAVMSSIKSLREGADRVADGDLVTPISLQTKDELQHVAISFNHMSEQLARRIKEAQQHSTELEELNTMLESLSATDGLTGISNRRRFDEVLAVEWKRSARLKQPITLGMLDVDWFKKYNDQYGHQLGDECLRRIAKAMADSIGRSGDVVARYGGEEFAFIALNCEGKHAQSIANNIVAAVEILLLPHRMSEFGHVTVSIGVASIIPKAGDVPDRLLKAADDALYEAKELGRNRVVIVSLDS